MVSSSITVGFRRLLTNDEPEQYKAIGFAKGGTLISLIVEVRKDDQGEYDWFVTLWKATKDEVKVYEQSN